MVVVAALEIRSVADLMELREVARWTENIRMNPFMRLERAWSTCPWFARGGLRRRDKSVWKSGGGRRVPRVTVTRLPGGVHMLATGGGRKLGWRAGEPAPRPHLSTQGPP
jgi:hypothetical protein